MTRTCVLGVGSLLLFGCGSPLERPAVPHEQAPMNSPVPEPALALLTPESSYAGRTVSAQVVGTETHFHSGTRVHFDDPEIVAQVVTSSRVNMRLNLSVGNGARLGAHDLIVETTADSNTGAERVTLPGALTVHASLTFEPPQGGGAAQQGGLVDLSVLNLDFQANPFATNTIAIVEGPRQVRFSSASSTRYSWLGVVDALAPPAPLSLKLSANNPLGRSLIYALDPQDPSVPIVARRDPVPLSLSGELRREQIQSAHATNLYSIEAPASEMVLAVSYGAVGLGLQYPGPTLAVAPPSGRFLDGQIIPTPSPNGDRLTALAFLRDPGRHYLSIFSAEFVGDAKDYQFDLSAKASTARRFELSEPKVPDTPEAPLAELLLTGPYYSLSGAIDTPADVDHIRVNTMAAGRIYVQAAGTPLSAVKVGILKADCATAVTVQRAFQQESAVEPDTSYCIRLSGSASTNYRLLIAPDLH